MAKGIIPDASPADGQVLKIADRFGWIFTRSMFAWLQGQASEEAAVAFQMSYYVILRPCCAFGLRTGAHQPSSSRSCQETVLG